MGEQASKFVFYQAVEDVNRNNIRADGRLYELKALQDAKKAPEYLALARTLPGYGSVVFPHCPCDNRKDGHVVPAVSIESLKLHACREDGTLESQTVEVSDFGVIVVANFDRVFICSAQMGLDRALGE